MFVYLKVIDKMLEMYAHSFREAKVLVYYEVNITNMDPRKRSNDKKLRNCNTSLKKLNISNFSLDNNGNR